MIKGGSKIEQSVTGYHRYANRNFLDILQEIIVSVGDLRIESLLDSIWIRIQERLNFTLKIVYVFFGSFNFCSV
jgi:hypothetical protein